MKRKIFAVLLALVMLLTGCGAPGPAANTSEPVDGGIQDVIPDTDAHTEETLYCESAIIDLTVHDDGYYCLMSDISVTMYDGQPIAVVIDDPALLAFQVSTFMDGGVYVFKLNEGDAVIESLTAVMEELTAKGETDLAAEIQEALDVFSVSGPFIQAST